MIVLSIPDSVEDFSDEYRTWNSCDPFDLFEAPINTFIQKVRPPARVSLTRYRILNRLKRIFNAKHGELICS